MLSDPDYGGYWEARYASDPTEPSGSGTYGAQGAWTRTEIERLIVDVGARTMIDLGCGRCDLYGDKLPVPEEDYMGVDVSPTAIAEAKAKFPNAMFVCQDLDTFVRTAHVKGWNDVIVCTDVLFHVDPDLYDRIIEWIVKNAEKGGLIKTIKVAVDLPDSFHWDHPIETSYGNHITTKIYSHPHNPKARLAVFQKGS